MKNRRTLAIPQFLLVIGLTRIEHFFSILSKKNILIKNVNFRRVHFLMVRSHQTRMKLQA